ncbi:cysteine protease ATG4-like [Silene latifolia]|uniref:cysteine protease ATG4-like n=1 Tax=Silene latifolia TaxID=37657 RepID=UPI003D76C49D
MKNLLDKISTSKSSSTDLSPKLKRSLSSSSCSGSSSGSSLLPAIVVSAFSGYESGRKSKGQGLSSGNGWGATVKRIMASGSIRRIKETMLGYYKSSVVVSSSDIWLLGVCYKVHDDSTGGDPAASAGFAAFVEDFSSRILMTYRKGFNPIGESKYTSDVNWGCMLRSSQMLVAQALIMHRFGRSWRKAVNKQLDEGYTEILIDFGDYEESAFSIHQLLEVGKGYGLAAGSWVGPYAMCRAWETLARGEKEKGSKLLPMAVYIVSGDEDGERGGAPVVCVEDVSDCCLKYSGGQADWAAVLLLVPLVLGLEKINPRYVPLLKATFAFPQSLGILGGKPGVSTYIIGVQDDNAFYLDPHEAQPVVDIKKGDLEADTSSYHSNVVRHVPLESIDSSLAIGFYCRDRDDFDDFCSRASTLADESNGAPLFTVAHCRSSPRATNQGDMAGGVADVQYDDSYDVLHSTNPEGEHEDDWQLL